MLTATAFVVSGFSLLLCITYTLLQVGIFLSNRERKRNLNSIIYKVDGGNVSTYSSPNNTISSSCHSDDEDDSTNNYLREEIYVNIRSSNREKAIRNSQTDSLKWDSGYDGSMPALDEETIYRLSSANKTFSQVPIYDEVAVDSRSSSLNKTREDLAVKEIKNELYQLDNVLRQHSKSLALSSCLDDLDGSVISLV